MSKINDYAAFVDQCTSDTSKDTTKMCDRVEYLRGDYTMQGNKVIDQEIDMARLMTALIGMMAESGEFAEVKRTGRCIMVLGSGMQSIRFYT